MTFIQINKKAKPTNSFALFNLGFRPFFLAAAVFALVSIALWLPVYFSYIPLSLGSLSSFQWHSHEMIYGYSMAVIAGFLLTAVMNWTGIQTLHGRRLFVLFLLWLVARISFLCGGRFLVLAALADILFMAGLFVSIAAPIVRVEQWRQLGVLFQIVVLTLSNLCFYAGAFGFLESGVYWGIYAGLYTIVALILTIGGRVIPAFIQNGVDYEVVVTNPLWITIVNFILFIAFSFNQLFVQDSQTLGYLSLGLFLVNAARLVYWHTPGIWKKPLLWSLYLSIVCIDLGFFLFVFTAFAGVSPFLAVHAFAFGGIGLATMGMMARVTLGHTGRNIRTPPALTTYALVILTIGVVFRVGFPFFDQARFEYWISIAQLSWISAFALFLVAYSRMLIQARFDGQQR